MSKTTNTLGFGRSFKSGGKNQLKLFAIFLVSVVFGGYSFWVTSFLSSQYLAILISPLVLFASLSWLLAARHWFAEMSASGRFEELIFIENIDADIEIIRGFRGEYYLKSLVVQIRMVNGSNGAVGFITTSFGFRFEGSLGEWKDISAKHGKIAPNRTATLSSSKFHLKNPFKISNGMTLLEGEILLTHKYSDIRSRKKAECIESKSVRILFNRESENLRYKTLFD